MRLTIVVFILLPISLFAQQIHYELAAPNAVHHEAEVSLTVKGIKPGPLFFRMSRSSPGRYATHEFGKNVYNVSATDGKGKTLQVEKTDAEVYKVNQQGTVQIQYTLYGNYADGTYTSIDPTGYHLNMPSTFMWVKGYEHAPITLRFTDVAKNWKIATQLKPTNDPKTFTAPNLQYFMDAPVKAGSLHWREWEFKNPDQKKYTFRLALEAEATDSMVNSFAQRLQKVVKETQAVFGEVPSFDYGTYTFLASLNPYVHGDGMEHRNSTMITSRRQFTGANNFLNTFVHEFFHCWNVERIRPQSLEPFNFEKSNMSEALWIAEGFTQYYTYLIMKRSGLMSEEEFKWQLSRLINAKENTPGGKNYSPVENSQRAVFVDASVSVDQTNYSNMFISYYSYGGALALALDLQLRSRFNKSLDGFMQQLWKTYGKKERPYTLSGVQQVLASFCTPAFAANFFNKHVYGHEPIDYNSLLQAAGFQLQNQSAGKTWIGDIIFANDTAQLKIGGNTIRNSPLYISGVDVDDMILQLGETKIKKPQDLENILSHHKPGETIQLIYKHRDQIIEKTITLAVDPAVTITKMESASPTQKKFRENWLEAKSN